MPTLIVHSRDDTLASFGPAEAAAARIPHARLLAHDSGGHLQLGRVDETQDAVQAFLSLPTQPTSSPDTRAPPAGAMSTGDRRHRLSARLLRVTPEALHEAHGLRAG